MTVEMVKEWVSLVNSDLNKGHSCVQNDHDIILNIEEKNFALHQNADIIFGKWIKGLI